LALGVTPRSISGDGQTIATAMDEEDLNSYSSLLANSDDHEHALLAHDAN
jgi:hypothetical protein